MAYLKPGAFQRKLFNRLAMMSGLGGATTLLTTGRKSGAELAVPVIPVEVGGQRYLVSTRGEAAWVRNLRASGGRGALRLKGKTTPFTAVEVPVEERETIIAAYREKAGRAVVEYWKQLPNAEDHPTFRLDT